MKEYIERSKVIDKFIEGDGDNEFTEGYNFAVNEYREIIKDIPASDVVKQFLDDVICECLDHKYCSNCPYYNKNVSACIFDITPELWESDKMVKIFEEGD